MKGEGVFWIEQTSAGPFWDRQVEFPEKKITVGEISDVLGTVLDRDELREFVEEMSRGLGESVLEAHDYEVDG